VSSLWCNELCFLCRSEHETFFFSAMMNFNEHTIRQVAFPAIFDKAQRLWNDTCVRYVFRIDSDIVGEVREQNTTYRAAIAMRDDEIVRFDCSCGFAYGSACEHVAAMMFTLASQGAAQKYPANGLQPRIDDIRGSPRIRCYLNEYSGMLFIEIRFAYFDGIVEFCRGDHSAHRLIPSLSADCFCRVIRMRAREDAACEAMSRYGLQSYKAGVFTPAGNAREWVLTELAHLAADGVEIYGQERLKCCRIRHGPPRVSVSVSSGSESLACAVAVSFDGVPARLGALVDAARIHSRYVILSDGSTGELSRQWVEMFAALFAVTQPGEGEAVVRMRQSQACMAEILLEHADERSVDDEFTRRCAALHGSDGIVSRPLPEGFRATLRPYQHAGFDWLCFLDDTGLGGCLADDMGLGKTIQTLALLMMRKQARRVSGPSLIIAPASIVFNWERETRRFAPALLLMTYHGGRRRRYTAADFKCADVVLTSYGTVLKDIDILEKIAFDYVVLDEAQAIKNPAAQISRGIRRLHARRRLALSGTPMENNLTELWSLFSFLNPGMLGAYARFVRSFAIPVQRHGDERAAAMLRRLTAPFILRRTKGQVERDLPPKTETIVQVEMLPRQRHLYNVIRDLYKTRIATAIERMGDKRSRQQVLEGLLRLRQICCHPALVDESFAGDSGKFEACEHFLRQTVEEGHRVLVFSQFVKALELAAARLAECSIFCRMLTGETHDRAKVVDSFQRSAEAQVLLVSLKAGGVGLNLTAADYVVHLDPWWNPAAERQATDRAYRIGQTRPVFVYKFVTVNSIEEQVLALQERKKDLIERFIDIEDSFVQQLSIDEILELFSGQNSED